MRIKKQIPPDTKEEKAKEIYDVRPMTIGLVSRGANRRAFFLLKNEGGTMPEDQELEIREEEDNAEVEPEPEFEEMDKQEALAESIVDRLKGLLTPVAKRKPRDPEAAAQRALGQIGGHPELTAASKALLEFIENARKRKPKGEGYGYGYPEPKAEGEKEMGEQSVAQSATPPTPTPDFATMMAEALKPIQQSLADLAAWQKQVEERMTKQAEVEATTAIAPLAKSLGLPTTAVLQLQKSLPPDDFAKVTDQMNRWRNAAFAGGMFGEIGSALGVDTAPSQEVLLQKRADEIAGAKKVDFARALVTASAELGLGLDAALPMKEEV